MRGKPEIILSMFAPLRITPAGAGKTVTTGVEGKMYEDHPRRCGENTPGGDAAFARAGSPPQVRGKPSFYRAHVQKDRITPAGAGKTFSEVTNEQMYQDHPRRCGEN